MEGIRVDLDKRTGKTAANMGDSVSMGKLLLLRVNIIYEYIYIYDNPTIHKGLHNAN